MMIHYKVYLTDNLKCGIKKFFISQTTVISILNLNRHMIDQSTKQRKAKMNTKDINPETKKKKSLLVHTSVFICDTLYGV